MGEKYELFVIYDLFYIYELHVSTSILIYFKLISIRAYKNICISIFRKKMKNLLLVIFRVF